MKAKANELRIGNWYNTAEGKPDWNQQLLGEDIARLEHSEKTITTHLYRTWVPIPLSVDWLERAGFGKSDEDEMGHNQNTTWGFYYDYHFRRLRLEVGDSNVVDIVMPMEYVHELQNLFFCLCGEELVFKERNG